MTYQILIATTNKGKITEIISILDTAEIQFLTPHDFNITESPDETGDDYETNAIIKARFYGLKSGVISIADDSGLEIHALDGFPGIKSARVKAPENTDKSRYEIILDMMKDVSRENRGARFVCVAAAYIPSKDTIITARAEWEGAILHTPSGSSGFGYDPVFFDPELLKSAAEMSTAEKNLYSHRGKAFRALFTEIEKNIQTF